MNQKAFFKTFFKRQLFSRKTFSLQVILSVAIGVGAVSGIQSYKSSLADLIRTEARNMMGADLAFQTPEKPRDLQNSLLQKTLPQGSQRAEVVQFLSMLQNPKNEEVALSMLRGIENQYPFYGKIETDPKDAYAKLKDSDILLEENLSKNLAVKIGDRIQVGERDYFFAGLIKKEPGSVGGFTGMAPTSIISKSSVDSTGLIEKGSRIRYTIFAKLPNNVDPNQFKKTYFEEYIKNDLTIFHNTEVNSGSQKFITNTLDFLSLLGLSSFFLGAVAIFISARTRVLDSQKQISILKCLGLESKYIRLMVLSETLSLSLIGVVFGLGLGYWIQSSLPNLLGGDGFPDLSHGITGIAFLEGLGLGIFIPLLVSLHSLIKAGMVSPMNALKSPDGVSDSTGSLSNRWSKMEYILLAAVYLLFFFVSWLDTGNIIKGLVLCSMFFLIPLLIWLTYQLLRWLLLSYSKSRVVSKRFSLVLKKFVRQYGLVSLSIIGLGSAIFVLLLSLILRESLLNLGGSRQLTKRPNVFIIDIKPDQKAGFESMVSKYSPTEYYLAPIIGARLSKINGEKIDTSQLEQDASKRDWKSTARTREYMLSYRDELFETESVDSGKWWKESSVNEISVEKDFSKSLGAGIGDELEFSIQGFPIKGRITNLRSVNWADMKPNFVVLFSKGDLESAPRYYISSFYIEDSAQRFQMQKQIVKAYPNITFIDTEKAVKSFEGIVEKVSAIINIMSGLLVIASIMLLVAVLYSSSRERFREMVLFRVVGAKQNFVRGIVLYESILLSFFSFFCSFILAMIADKILNQYVLNLESIYPVFNMIMVAILVFFGILFAYILTSRKLFSLPVKTLMKMEN
ncbi:MAG: FtsX-like permease family protein [Leptospiraceae bacterium]|nr:FtsX-like permease family protein [Leptospiraceae bacterium]